MSLFDEKPKPKDEVATCQACQGQEFEEIVVRRVVATKVPLGAHLPTAPGSYDNFMLKCIACQTVWVGNS